MTRKYSIGLLVAVVVLLLVITFGYHKEYEYVKKQTNIDTVTAQGKAIKESVFCLKDLNGYVVVYLEDGETIYEYTDIKVKDLPEVLQQEIGEGKQIFGIEKLYGFLENYSS